MKQQTLAMAVDQSAGQSAPRKIAPLIDAVAADGPAFQARGRGRGRSAANKAAARGERAQRGLIAPRFHDLFDTRSSSAPIEETGALRHRTAKSGIVVVGTPELFRSVSPRLRTSGTLRLGRERQQRQKRHAQNSTPQTGEVVHKSLLTAWDVGLIRMWGTSSGEHLPSGSG